MKQFLCVQCLYANKYTSCEKYPETIKKIFSELSKNCFDNNFDVNDLSRKCNISRIQLNDQLKIKLNITPKELIKRMRLEKSLNLMMNKKLSIQDIARESGHNHTRTFRKLINNQFKVSPNMLREKLNSNNQKSEYLYEIWELII